MTKAEMKAEMELLNAIFAEEQDLLDDLSQPQHSRRDTEKRIRTHVRKHYAKNLLAIHTHHRTWPVTGRPRPGRHPAKGVTDLASFYVDYMHKLERLPRQFATLVWANVKEEKKTGERVAVACLVYEGLRQFRAETRWQEDEHSPYYCHMSAYVLRKKKARKGARPASWKVEFLVAGLPVENVHAPGGKVYRRKITDKTKFGQKGKKQYGIKDFEKLHALYEADSNDEYEEGWYKAIARGKETTKLDFTWNEFKSRSLDTHFWDLLGWDVVINRAES